MRRQMHGRRAVAAACALLPVTLFGTALAQETLAPIVVEDQAGGASGADDGYVAKETTTGSKITTPLKEIPQSVSVITRKELDERKPAQLQDAIAYTSGIVAAPWGTDGRFDECLIRGFDLCTGALYRDGLSQKVIGFSGFKIEPYGMERFEVLKGPASVLYGQNEAGGLINAVTKRPTADPLYSGYVSYGSFDTVEAGIDVGGPIDPAGVWSYRLTGLYRDGSTQIDHTDNDRVYIAPALTWQPDAQTSLTVLANYQWDKLSAIYSVPVPGITDNYTGPLVGRNFFTGQPGYDRFDADHGSIGYQFSHEFNDAWTVRQNLRFAHQNTDYAQLYFGDADGGDAVLPDGHTIARTAYAVKDSASIFNVDNQAEYHASLGPAENKLLLGLDYNRFDVDEVTHYGAAPSLDMTDPDYSQVIDPPLYEDYRQTIGQVGLYLQNQTKIDERIVVSFGLRQEWVDNTTRDHLTGDSSAQKDDALVRQIGAAYLFDSGVTPYVSYAESFTVNTGQTREGDNFVPSLGKQYEAGVKYQPTFFPGSITAAVFDLRKTNVLTTDPDDSNFQVQTGEVRHRGFELEAKADLDLGLSLTAAYTYVDAVITRDNDGFEGNRPSLVPENTASLWANYQFGENTPLAGLSLGAGVRYVGSTFGDNENTVRVPAYALVDAALRYKHGSWEAALNISNLFDKKYFSTCYPGEGCYYGEARNIRGSLNVKF